MASYSSLVKEVLPYVPFCPDSLVEQQLRSATIEFCERSKAYILDVDPFNTIAGVYEYDFDIPTGTEVHQILLMTHDGKDMDPISPRSLELNYPDWRDRTGNPHVYLQKTPTTFWLVPVPSGSKQIITSVALKPSRTSNNIDTTISNTYRDALIYGTLSETFSFLKTPQDVQLYEQKYAQAVQNLAQTQMGRKRRDEYADGVLRIPLKSVGPGGR